LNCVAELFRLLGSMNNFQDSE